MHGSISGVGTEAVRKLRMDKLRNGAAFMINSRELPDEQCYIEYPDGIIKLVKIAENRRDFIVLREFSEAESSSIRLRFHLV